MSIQDNRVTDSKYAKLLGYKTAKNSIIIKSGLQNFFSNPKVNPWLAQIYVWYIMWVCPHVHIHIHIFSLT